MSRIFPSEQERQASAAERERDALAFAAMKERNQVRKPYRGSYPGFDSEVERDVYLGKLIANGYRVKARDTPDGFTVEEIDRRKGK